MMKQETLLPSNEQDLKRRNRCYGGSICFACCLTFILLLVFLVPRAPYAQYEGTVVYFSPYRVIQTYKVYNRNIYSLSLSDFEMVVTTTTSSGTFQSANGTLEGGSNTFTVPKNSNKEMSLIYYWNTTSAQNQAIRTQCRTAGGVTYETTGTMNMKTSVTNFHDVDLGPWDTTYYCST